MSTTSEPTLTMPNIRSSSQSHIILLDPTCCEGCRAKPCLSVCPGHVFQPNSPSTPPISIDYQKCLECGACLYLCPSQNIQAAHPPGGCGVQYQEG